MCRVIAHPIGYFCFVNSSRQKIMGIINKSDIIFATLFQRGRQVASIRMSGVASWNDVIAFLSKVVTECKGLTTLRLRNGSQGWTQQRSIIMKQSEAVQLSLF